ncbi:nitrogen fixation protein NifZ [Methylocystis parvus]|uniref:Nitrogen fixation protein NifZ n=1 Tax=Methylocystis parvus TaxID=134 RepID=A0A6B8MAC2_9HYPH|nr:nitrogen fixation protein NifZ [Methylocystis parvus]QGM99375.1 nitrogen fixation protein NifZ [Methylocystis parvus]WBK00233.1 nitrogen fixation protein NifZ [Methylocystis parvus OBBP]
MSGPAKFDWGMRVRATTDLVNDGSYPERADEELLVKTGDTGEIVNVGMHVETETPVYLVEFSPQLIIGCLEDEIEPV